MPEYFFSLWICMSARDFNEGVKDWNTGEIIGEKKAPHHRVTFTLKVFLYSRKVRNEQHIKWSMGYIEFTHLVNK